MNLCGSLRCQRVSGSKILIRRIADPATPSDSSTIRSVVGRDGEVWATYRREAEAIVIDFPGLATFRLSGGKVVERQAQASLDVLDHLYENQIAPLLWSQSGKVALHAGAVTMAGAAVAFVGDTGIGKSTLTTFLAGRGASLITDDTLLIERRGNDFMALPGSGKIRLWRDSGNALLGPDANTLPAFRYTSKGRFNARAHFVMATEPVPLKRLYFLEANGVGAPVAARIGGSDALFACTSSSFLLDWMDPVGTAKHFDSVTALCRSVDTYTLDYPRSFEFLPLVEDVVLAHEGLGSI